MKFCNCLFLFKGPIQYLLTISVRVGNLISEVVNHLSRKMYFLQSLLISTLFSKLGRYSHLSKLLKNLLGTV